MPYNHKLIEEKWSKIWSDNNTYYCDVYDFSKPKYYVLDMFPYPSGQGLHVGHPEGYTASDIIARMKRMQGYNVLHPMGWDAFGLPAEQYSIKMNRHPYEFTKTNIQRFKKQIQSFGFSYDWDKEIATCEPSYYKWTQDIFLKLYNKDLAYIDYRPVNFCPELGTVLANEEVIDGKSEVGGFDVIRKPMRQWLLKITQYSEKLLEGLDSLDWPSSTIEMQKNWIGKSTGAIVTFKIKNFDDLSFDVFTTRVDTLYGCSYTCLAPEHPLVLKICDPKYLDEVKKYQEEVSHKSDLDRQKVNKEKSGVFIGAYAINPINNEEVPIYIADYVLASYGTGAVMAVPAHDQRDYEFAKAHNLKIKKVLENDVIDQAFEDDAKHINSDIANGLYIDDAKKVILEKLKSLNLGKEKTSYKIRDWLFSRQRYWGEPIPIILMDDGSLKPLNENELPLVLPELDEYKPSGTGESPLIHAKDWLNVTVDGKHGTRETNTMPQWAGSCWYYIRYIDPHNDKAIGDPKLLKHWLPVDLYIGGAEHAVLHLLYARFWHKFLYDEGIVFCKEPFKKLFHQGMILGSNGEKMSKSRGNVVNPDELIESFGADALRLYEMFMGPLEASLPWSSQGLEGARRFLDRVYRLFSEDDYKKKISDTNSHELDYSYNFMVKKVTNDFENLQFNTAISQMMIFINDVYKSNSIYKPYLTGFVKMLSCICPFLGEELYQMLGYDELIDYQSWPTYDESMIKLDEINIAVQVNGKLRANISVNKDIDDDSLKEKIFQLEAIIRHTQGKTIKKIIIVKNKIVNIVAI